MRAITAKKHGTLSMYMQGKCRCEPCAKHYSRYMKQLRYDIYVGKPSRLVDAAPAQAHIAKLRESGMSTVAICNAAERKRQWLYSILEAKRVQPATEARVLAIRPWQDRRPDSYTDASGTIQRLRDLALLGWPSRTIGKELGIWHDTVLDIMNGESLMVRKRTALGVLALHDRIGGTRGPSPRTAEWAAKAFPDNDPSEVCAICENVAFLRRSVEEFFVIAERVGMSTGSLDQHLRRHGNAALIGGARC